jgi:RNA polymerase sigma factor (sigma-70 family)
MSKSLPISDTYNDVEKLIYHVANKVHAKHGGDIEELVSEANVAFMKAYKAYSPDRHTKFSTFLYCVIWNHLLTFIRDNRSMPVVDTGSVVDNRPEPFMVWDFVEGLTEDAATVVGLVFTSPAELVEAAEGKGNQIRNWRSSIRRYLLNQGWSTDRVIECFSEIAAALG